MKRLILTISLLVLPALALAAVININTAGLEELQELTGVGPVIAERIIDYRESNGPFKTIEEIKNVKGIGDVTFLKMKDQITVGDGSASDDTSLPEDTIVANTSSSSNSSSNNNSSSSLVLSAHASQTTVNTTQDKTSWQISAGRERVVLAGSPVEIKVETVSGAVTNPKFVWALGDGLASVGEKVTHYYRHPGRYEVVVTGKTKLMEAVSRTKVLVLPADLSFKPVANGWIIKNNLSSEVNLGLMSLQVGSTTLFVIPQDTLLAVGGELLLDPQMIGIKDNFNQVSLVSPSGLILNQVDVSDRLARLQDLQAQLLKAKEQLARLSVPVVAIEPVGEEANLVASVGTIELGSKPKENLLSRWFNRWRVP